MTFLKKQKLANCPCQVHTKTRGYDWVVFRRQPDRTPTLYYEQTESESEEEIQEEYEDDDYYSVDPVDIENDEKKEDQDVTGAAAPESSVLPADETAKKSDSGDNTSIHSRKKRRIKKKRSQKRSPLKEMKKIWNPRILMILMHKKIEQEEGTTSYVSNH